ncbi:DUF389 domain-containing protein (plasmid) [Haloferacaceae archaeon DSL9]
MRLIQIRVSDDARQSVTDVLEGENADYVTADEAADSDASIVYFPIPAGAVEEMLDRLHDAGLDEDAFTIVTEIETATTPNFDELEGRYTSGPDDEIGLSHVELRTKAQELTPETTMFVVFASLSSIVATAGLLLNSAIIITGAMVISPFAGSLLSTSVGAISADWVSVARSVRSQLLGLAVSVVSATGASFAFRSWNLVPSSLAISNVEQVSSFGSPTLLAITIAVVAGAAGALALATDLPVSIAGVAVAAAIVPATGVMGIGVVWGQPMLVLGASALLFANVAFVNGTALLGLLAVGYRPSNLSGFSDGFPISPRTAFSALGVVVLGALVVAVFAMTVQFAVFEQTVAANVDEVMSESVYSDLELVDVRTEYSDTHLFGREDTVTVVVARTAGTSHPSFPDAVQRAIEDDTDRTVTVQVQFVEYERAESRTRAGSSPAPTVRADA